LTMLNLFWVSTIFTRSLMDTNPDFFLKVILQSQLTDSSVEFLCWNFIFGNDRFSAEKTAEKFRIASDFHIEIWLGSSFC
jgi:hypothetical protein